MSNASRPGDASSAGDGVAQQSGGPFTSVEPLIGALDAVGLDIDVDNLLDTLWLASRGVALGLHVAAAIEEAVPLDGPDDPHPEEPPYEPPHEDGAPAPPPADQSSASDVPLYARLRPSAGDRTVKATPVSIPAGRALAHRLKFMRALRPLRQRWSSRQFVELDEERTVEETAQWRSVAPQHVVPVFRPRLEPWYDVELVVEDDDAIEVWTETLRDFAQLMRDTGAFRSVRSWRLRLAGEGAADSANVLENPTGARMPVSHLAGRGVRRLVIFATNGVSAHWLDGRYARILDAWLHNGSALLLQLTSPHRWPVTRLGEPHGLCAALQPGAIAAALHMQAFWWRPQPASDEGDHVVVPVVPLEPHALDRWAHMQMSRGERCPASLLAPRPRDPVPPPALTGRQIQRAVADLRHACPQAFQLAVWLSPTPFTIPVARLVSTTQFGPAADQRPLAELLQSGLVTACRPEPGTGGAVEYDFRPSAREVLLRSLRDADALLVSRELRRKVSQTLAQIAGSPQRSQQLVRDDGGIEQLPYWAQPFADAAAAMLGVRSAPPGAPTWLQRVRDALAASGLLPESIDIEALRQPPEAQAFGRRLMLAESDTGRCFANHLLVAAAAADAIVSHVVLHVQGRLVVAARRQASDTRPGYATADWEGLIGRGARQGSVVWAEDVAAETDYIAAEPRTRSELVIPIHDQREPRAVVGLVNLEMPVPRALDAEQRQWLVEFVRPLCQRVVSGRPATWLWFDQITPIRLEQKVSQELVQRERAVQPLRSIDQVNVSDAILMVEPVKAQRDRPLSLDYPFNVRGLEVFPGRIEFILRDDATSIIVNFGPLWAGLTRGPGGHDLGIGDLAALLDPRGGFASRNRDKAPPEPAPRSSEREMEVLYATDRGGPAEKRAVLPRPGVPGHTLVYGIARVNVPRRHRIGAVERPSALRLQFSTDREKHFDVVGLEPLDEPRMPSVARKRASSALMYVHGFNTGFEEGLFRCAQLCHDLSPDLAPLYYSWPSASRQAAYVADQAAAERSARLLADWLQRMHRMGPEPLHVWAHGMGSLVLLRALERTRIEGRPLGQIILTNADVDAGWFAQVAPHVAESVDRITLYVSNEASLSIAGSLTGSARAGATAHSVPGVDVVVLTGVDTPLGESPSVARLADVSALLMRNEPPERRFGLRPLDTDAGRLWLLGDGPPPAWARSGAVPSTAWSASPLVPGPAKVVRNDSSLPLVIAVNSAKLVEPKLVPVISLDKENSDG